MKLKTLKRKSKKTPNQIINSLTAKNLEMHMDMDKMVTLLKEMKETNQFLRKKNDLLEETLEKTNTQRIV